MSKLTFIRSMCYKRTQVHRFMDLCLWRQMQVYRKVAQRRAEYDRRSFIIFYVQNRPTKYTVKISKLYLLCLTISCRFVSTFCKMIASKFPSEVTELQISLGQNFECLLQFYCLSLIQVLQNTISLKGEPCHNKSWSVVDL